MQVWQQGLLSGLWQQSRMHKTPPPAPRAAKRLLLPDHPPQRPCPHSLKACPGLPGCRAGSGSCSSFLRSCWPGCSRSSPCPSRSRLFRQLHSPQPPPQQHQSSRHHQQPGSAKSSHGLCNRGWTGAGSSLCSLLPACQRATRQTAPPALTAPSALTLPGQGCSGEGRLLPPCQLVRRQDPLCCHSHCSRGQQQQHQQARLFWQSLRHRELLRRATMLGTLLTSEKLMPCALWTTGPFRGRAHPLALRRCRRPVIEAPAGTSGLAVRQCKQVASIRSREHVQWQHRPMPLIKVVNGTNVVLERP